MRLTVTFLALEIFLAIGFSMATLLTNVNNILREPTEEPKSDECIPRGGKQTEADSRRGILVKLGGCCGDLTPIQYDDSGETFCDYCHGKGKKSYNTFNCCYGLKLIYGKCEEACRSEGEHCFPDNRIIDDDNTMLYCCDGLSCTKLKDNKTYTCTKQCLPYGSECDYRYDSRLYMFPWEELGGCCRSNGDKEFELSRVRCVTWFATKQSNMTRSCWLCALPRKKCDNSQMCCSAQCTFGYCRAASDGGQCWQDEECGSKFCNKTRHRCEHRG